MSMKIRPLHDRIIIKRREEEEVSEGGILLPGSAKEKPMAGEVMAVGPGKLLESGQRSKMDVSEGDHVLFGKYAGTEVKIDGDELLVLREEDIMGVVQR